MEAEYKPSLFYLAHSPTPSKAIDIFQHIKLGLKGEEDNCNCRNTQQYYCIPCKVSICANCNLEYHKKHFIIEKKQFELSDDKIEQVMSPLNQTIKSCLLLENTQKMKTEFVKKVDQLFNQIESALEEYKNRTHNEIDMLFDSLEHRKSGVYTSINQVKQNISSFLAKNKKFFNAEVKNKKAGLNQLEIDLESNYNTDSNNLLFLMDYDMINILEDKSKTIAESLDKLVDSMNQYQDEQIRELQKIKKEMIQAIEENTNMSRSDLKNSDKKVSESGQEEMSKRSSMLMKPTVKQFCNACEDLSINYFEPINKRISIYNLHINNFKKVVFSQANRIGGMKELEKSIAVFEKSKQKGADALFTERKQTIQSNKMTEESRTISRSSKAFTTNPHVYSEKDEVILNNPSLVKYFSYLTLDLYGKNFRIVSKELQSSHADLKIEVNEDEKTEEEENFGKAIEGTNQIVIYDKRLNTLTKKVLPLTKNPFGYTKFPIGCRSILIGNKLYITGGRDEYREFGNVLIYDRKTEKIKRIMDLCEPRSYHTLVYNEVFNTIMVIGGEDKRTVEIFDPITNRWQNLPLLNVPRANPSFYFDKPRGIMYVLFGVEGEFKNGKYTNVIEFLDLGDPTQGWNIMDYQNKSMVDLKSMMKIYPLNGDIILLYGGISFRNSTKSLVMLDIPKMEVVNIDPKLLEALRIESKKSKTLSTIISGLSSSPSILNK